MAEERRETVKTIAMVQEVHPSTRVIPQRPKREATDVQEELTEVEALLVDIPEEADCTPMVVTIQANHKVDAAF